MCDCCDITNVNTIQANDYYMYKSFYLVDEYTHEVLEATGRNPVLYLRQYKLTDHWSLICEFADDKGTVIESPVNFCPICGDRLAGKNKEY